MKELHEQAINSGFEQLPFAYMHWANYKAKNNKPCFISENTETFEEAQSYQEMYEEVLKTIKTKDFLSVVAENYDCDKLVSTLENVNESTIDFEDVYLEITNQTPEQFAHSFLDSYFLGGDDIWCSISTKLSDYMM